MTQLARLMVAAIGSLSLLLVAGCQSASTTNSTASKSAAAQATLVANPRPVVVRDFLFEVSQLHKDQGLIAGREGPVKRIVGGLRGEETPAQKAARYAALLSESIVKELSVLKIPAQRELTGAALPENAFVVGGEFLEVDEGNRLKRAIVGFGAGATEVLAQVAVYDLTQSREHPILVFGTGSGSKPMPGAAVTLNPYVMAAKYVLSRGATEKDVRNLGKQVARDLAQIEAGGSPKH